MKDDGLYDKASELVSQEVYACISDMAEYLFDFDGASKYASYDEWMNMYGIECPNCGALTGDRFGTEDFIECSACGEMINTNDAEFRGKEIFEYWIVSPYLGEQLRDLGEPTLERWGGWIWGRTCTGQAIALDWVIQEIVRRREERVSAILNS